MNFILFVQSLSIVAAQLCAGLFVLQIALGKPNSLTMRMATALILGPAVLCIEMIILSTVRGAYSYEVVVVPWLVLAGAWLARSLLRRQLAVGTEHLALAALTAVYLSAAPFFSAPASGGDPASNFAAFGRLYGHLGRVDPARAEALSVFGHFEYPPLLATNESLFFQLDDASGAQLLMVFASTYGLALLLLGWRILTERAVGLARTIGTLLAVLLFVQPTTIRLTFHAYADLPLVCAFLWMLYELLELSRPTAKGATNYSAVLLAGITLALTKNEGMILASGLALLVPFMRSWRSVWVPILVTSVAIAWPLWLSTLGFGSDLIEGTSSVPSVDRFSRLPRVIETFFECVFLYRYYPTWSISTFAWTVALLVVGSSIWRRSVHGLRLIFVGAATHTLLYAVILTNTTQDIEWHLMTTSNRLVFHLVPYLLLAAGVSLRTGADSETRNGHPKTGALESV